MSPQAKSRVNPQANPYCEHRPIWALLAGALAAGLCLSLSLPPWGLWILAFPGAALLWWLLEQSTPKRRLLAGGIAGIGMFGPGLWWSLSFNTYGGIALILLESLFIGIACLAVPSRSGRLVALPGAMLLAEALRSTWPFGGLPMGGIALGQASGPLAGTARIGGPLLLVGLVWLGGAGIASLLLSIVRPSFCSPCSSTKVAIAAGVALATVLVFAVVASEAPDGGPAIRTEQVAAVQGGGVRGLNYSQVVPQIVLFAQFAATSSGLVDAPSQPRSILVLWPEDVVAVDGLLADSPDQEQLSNLAGQLNATLVVGVTETVSQTAFRNEMIAIAPDGQIVSHYEKVHRVPFGEYIPYRSFFEHFANLSGVPLDAVPGTRDGVLKTPVGDLGTMISYEVFYANRGRIPTRNGAQLLLVPTNTSSYSTGQVPAQEIASSRLQAIAEGRDLVQAAPTGYSAIINNRGRLETRSSLGRRQVLIEYVALRNGSTIYERLGDTPWLLLAALALAAGWVLALVDRKRSGDSQMPAGGRRLGDSGIPVGGNGLSHLNHADNSPGYS